MARIGENYKDEMVARAKTWLAAYEADKADISSLEMAAEYLLQAAKLDPNFDAEELEEDAALIDKYNEEFVARYLKLACDCILEEFAA